MSAVLEDCCLFVVGAVCEGSCSDSYHQYFAKENGHRQMLDNNFPLQSTLTPFVV